MGRNYFNLLDDGDHVTELFDIVPDRADLVSFPAIARKFLLVKSAFSTRSLEELYSMGHTTEQVLISIPSPIASLCKEGGNESLIDKASNFIFKEIDGTINVKGVRKSLKNLESADWIPPEIHGAAKDELLKAWEVIKSTNKGEALMDEIIKAIEGLVAKVKDNQDLAKQAQDALDQFVAKSENETLSPEAAQRLLDIVKEAFVDETAITKESFDAVIGKMNSAIEESKKEIVEKAEIAKAAEIQSKLTQVSKDLESSREEFKKAQEELKALRFEKQRNDLVSKAATDMKCIGKSAEEIGDLLMELKGAGIPEKTFEAVCNLLKSTSEMIDKSGFFVERGTEIEATEEGDQDDIIMKEARDLVEKGSFKTVEQAYTHIIINNPDKRVAVTEQEE